MSKQSETKVEKTVTIRRAYETLDEAKRDADLFRATPSHIMNRIPKPDDFHVRPKTTVKVEIKKGDSFVSRHVLEIELMVTGAEADITAWAAANEKLNMVKTI